MRTRAGVGDENGRGQMSRQDAGATKCVRRAKREGPLRTNPNRKNWKPESVQRIQNKRRHPVLIATADPMRVGILRSTPLVGAEGSLFPTRRVVCVSDEGHFARRLLRSSDVPGTRKE